MAYGQWDSALHDFTLTTGQGQDSKQVIYTVPSSTTSRYGTNTPKTVALKDSVKPVKCPVIVYKTVTRRTPVGIKKNGKTRYVYDRVTVMKSYFPKSQKKKRNRSGRFIKPNELQFWKSKLVTAFDGSASGRYPPVPTWGPRFMIGAIAGAIRNPYADFYWQGSSDQTYSPNMYMRDPVGLIASVYEDLDARALNKLYNNVKHQDVNLAVALAEAHKTVSMIATLATRIAKALILAKKGNLIGAIRSLGLNSTKDFANLHLALMYGIKPLMSDIEGLTTMLMQRSYRTETYHITAASGIRGKEMENYRLHSTDFAGRSEVKSLFDVYVKYSVTVSIKSNIALDLSRLGFTNPWELAWELVPFSFVVDWFLPIGNYLKNLDAFAFLKVESVHRTTVVKETVVSQTRVFGTDSAGTEWTNSGGSGWVVENFGVRREPLLLVPDLPAPSFKSPVSTGHLANALALFIQLKK